MKTGSSTQPWSSPVWRSVYRSAGRPTPSPDCRPTVSAAGRWWIPRCSGATSTPASWRSRAGLWSRSLRRFLPREQGRRTRSSRVPRAAMPQVAASSPTCSADRDLVVLGSAPTILDVDAPDNSHPNGWIGPASSTMERRGGRSSTTSSASEADASGRFRAPSHRRSFMRPC